MTCPFAEAGSTAAAAAAEPQPVAAISTSSGGKLSFNNVIFYEHGTLADVLYRSPFWSAAEQARLVHPEQVSSDLDVTASSSSSSVQGVRTLHMTEHSSSSLSCVNVYLVADAAGCWPEPGTLPATPTAPVVDSFTLRAALADPHIRTVLLVEDVSLMSSVFPPDQPVIVNGAVTITSYCAGVVLDLRQLQMGWVVGDGAALSFQGPFYIAGSAVPLALAPSSSRGSSSGSRSSSGSGGASWPPPSPLFLGVISAHGNASLRLQDVTVLDNDVEGLVRELELLLPVAEEGLIVQEQSGQGADIKEWVVSEAGVRGQQQAGRRLAAAVREKAGDQEQQQDGTEPPSPQQQTKQQEQGWQSQQSGVKQSGQHGLWWVGAQEEQQQARWRQRQQQRRLSYRYRRALKHQRQQVPHLQRAWWQGNAWQQQQHVVGAAARTLQQQLTQPSSSNSVWTFESVKLQQQSSRRVCLDQGPGVAVVSNEYELHDALSDSRVHEIWVTSSMKFTRGAWPYVHAPRITWDVDVWGCGVGGEPVRLDFSSLTDVISVGKGGNLVWRGGLLLVRDWQVDGPSVPGSNVGLVLVNGTGRVDYRVSGLGRPSMLIAVLPVPGELSVNLVLTHNEMCCGPEQNASRYRPEARGRKGGFLKAKKHGILLGQGLFRPVGPSGEVLWMWGHCLAVGHVVGM